MDTLLDQAQEEAIPLAEWTLTPIGHCKPKDFTIQFFTFTIMFLFESLLRNWQPL